MHNSELIPHLYRTERSKMIAVLTKVFGLAHVEWAEDIVGDTFLAANESWKEKGTPENPTAWLYRVAKNKTRDFLRRHQHFSQKIVPDLQLGQKKGEEIELDWSSDNISDSQLRMMFAICHPEIPEEAQIGLALRVLCGFGIDEIATAFLTSKSVINKRLYRAKEKLRKQGITLDLPKPATLEQRLTKVLHILYLVFNEGYYAQLAEHQLRKDLCFEAMRLNHLLLQYPPTNQPAVNALLSLMCFHASRFEARIAADGSTILYDEQDRKLWDDELIAKGNHFLIQSAKGEVVTKYHLEASIAYWHSTKQQTDSKWEHILQLYNQLLQVEYSPITALNRTYALAKARGEELGIKEAEKLGLEGNYAYHILLGKLYTPLSTVQALKHFEQAKGKARSEIEKQMAARYIGELMSG